MLLPHIYRYAHERVSGAYFIEHSASSSYLEFVSGWIHKIDVSGSPTGDGPARLAVLLERDVKAISAGAAQPQRAGECRPFHPALALRTFVESHAATTSGPLSSSTTWQVRLAPHPSCLAEDERPLIALLAEPRTLAELEGVAALPQRLYRLCAFLRAVGALQEVRRPTDLALLELPAEASAEAIKQAYHRLARDLHPDRHPGASQSESARLTARFAEVTAAYHRLIS